MTAGYRPADAARLRREMTEWTRAYGTMWTTYMIGVGRQNLAPDAPSAVEAAAVLASEEVARLAGAEVFYADAEVATLVQRIAPSMPLFAPRPWDFPAPSGFILYGAPMASRPIDRTERAYADRMGIDPGTLDLDAEVVAASWGPWQPGEGYPGWATALPVQAKFWRAGGGVWISFYADRLPEAHARVREARADLNEKLRRAGRTARGQQVAIDEEALVRAEQLAAFDSPLHPENETAFALRPDGDLPEGGTEDDYGIADVEGTISPWARALLATFLLMRQDGVGQTTAERVPRPERRRHVRAKLPEPGDIHVIRLHRRAPAPARPDTPPTGRQLTVRFPVGPFWRNQWYPATRTHRPKLIAQYLKGPVDAPMVGAERVRIIAAPPIQEDP